MSDRAGWSVGAAGRRAQSSDEARSIDRGEMEQTKRIVTAGQRITWLDSLRGLAIIAVVLGHINIGIMGAGLAGDHLGAYRQLHTLLYLLHMPLFALLFGVNIPPAWEKHANWSYVRSRLWNFAYLYLVWTLIQGAFEVVGARFANGETTWADVLRIDQPIAHLWFLPWAFLAYLLLVALKPWRSLVTSIVMGVVLAALSWLTWGQGDSLVFLSGAPLIIFVFFGALMGAWMVQRLQSAPPALIAPLGVVLFAVPFILVLGGRRPSIPTLFDPGLTSASKLLGIIASLAGVFGLFVLASLLGRRGRSHLLELAGRCSLQIYLMHLLITPPVRIILARLGVEQPLVVLTISLILGVGIPILVSRYLGAKLWWLFRAPSLSHRGASDPVHG